MMQKSVANSSPFVEFTTKGIFIEFELGVKSR